MAERAWEDLIASGRYSYGAFAAHVESVVDELAGGRVRSGQPQRGLLARAQCGQRRLCRRSASARRGSPTAPRCATPRGPRTPCCADATPCGAEPPDDAPRRCGRPAARARSRSAARRGGCSCSTSTRRQAPCGRRCARRCACSRPAPRDTRSSTGTPATACRGRSGGCPVDAVILDNTLLVARWAPEFAARRPTFDWLADVDALKIAFPQDEYNHAHVLDDWLADLGIDVVFSVFGPEHRELLYPRLGGTARFEKCLTGYVDELDVTRHAARRPAARPPRARPRVPRAGSDAALRAARPAQAHRRRDGRPGGPRRRACASTSRPTRAMPCSATAGSPSSRPRAACWAARAAPARSTGAASSWPPSAACWPSSPGLAFAEFDAAMPAGWDGQLPGSIGPRHLEAAAARTCQILVEGGYDGVLEPDVHYLPVRPDFSDVEAVVERLADRDARRGHGDARLRRPRAERPLRLRRAGRPARARAGRGAAGDGRSCRRRPAAPRPGRCGGLQRGRRASATLGVQGGRSRRPRRDPAPGARARAVVPARAAAPRP